MLKDSRHRVALLLLVVWILSFIRFHDVRHLLYSLIVISIGVSLDAIFQRLRGKKVFPSSALVTSLLVILILAPESGLAPMVTAVVFAVLSKHVLRSPRHWFNPAAFGIVVSAWLFRVPVSWWAVSWSWIPAGLTVIWMLFVLQRLKRLWLPTTFLLVYLTWLAAITAAGFSIVRLFLDGTIILFAFVMLPEPMTSPAFRSWKYLFGTLVGVFVIAVSWLLRFVPFQTDVLLVSLLLADAVAVVARRKAST